MKDYLKLLLRINLDLFFIVLIAACLSIVFEPKKQVAEIQNLAPVSEDKPQPTVTAVVQKKSVRTEQIATEQVMTAPTTEPVQEPVSKMSQLSQHSTEADCWMSYKGHVYDFTSYLSSHPGGKSILVASCGKNIDTGFDTKGKSPGSEHSAFALSQLQAYLIE
jgi:cytochrome b involved in lipid metabolism